MRPIRFRAWDLVKKEMIYNPIVCGIGFFADEYVGLNDLFASKFSERKLEIMQFTGLLDKDGRAIFEGDILAGHEDGNTKVIYQGSAWLAEFFDANVIPLDELCVWFGNEARIIGNIWENPELIKETPCARAT